MLTQTETICPFCARVYAPGDMDDDYPMCRDCNLEGRSIMVDDLGQFLEQVTSKQVDLLIQQWSERNDLVVVQRGRILNNFHALRFRLSTREK